MAAAESTIKKSTPKHIEYHPHNPLSPTNHELEGTGPEHCENCRYHGTDKEGLWRGYCLNCAIYHYNFLFGFGYSDGKETTYDEYIIRSAPHTEVYKSLLKNIISWDEHCGYTTTATITLDKQDWYPEWYSKQDWYPEWYSKQDWYPEWYSGSLQEKYDNGDMDAEYYAYSQELEETTSEELCDSP